MNLLALGDMALDIGSVAAAVSPLPAHDDFRGRIELLDIKLVLL